MMSECPVLLVKKMSENKKWQENLKCGLVDKDGNPCNNTHNCWLVRFCDIYDMEENDGS
jgi:hypothetical protein